MFWVGWRLMCNDRWLVLVGLCCYSVCVCATHINRCYAIWVGWCLMCSDRWLVVGVWWRCMHQSVVGSRGGNAALFSISGPVVSVPWMVLSSWLMFLLALPWIDLLSWIVWFCYGVCKVWEDWWWIEKGEMLLFFLSLGRWFVYRGLFWVGDLCLFWLCLGWTCKV